MFMPPSTWMTCPVTYEDKSLARKVATLAMSSTVPPLLRGIFAIHSLRMSSESWAVIAVSMNPGAMALALTPLLLPLYDLSAEEIRRCREITDSLGVKLRVRKYIEE